MKKLLAVVFSVLLILAVSCAWAEEAAPKRYSFKDWQYILLEDGSAEIDRYWGDDEELIIPAEIGGHTVTSIGDAAFDSCPSPTSITIPDSVTAIGDYAFSGCSSLTTITIPDSTTEIGINPFESCIKLTDIIVSPDHPVLATIDGVLFSKAEKKLICYPRAYTNTSYTIPQGIRIIGDHAFYKNTSLASITIPDSVTEIGNDAFSLCLRLTSIEIPNSVTKVGINPFNSLNLSDIIVSPDHPALATIDGILFDKQQKRLICFPYALNITSYAIPQGIQIIGDNAFSSNRSLTSVTIPDSVTVIGNSAFFGCRSLSNLTIPDSVTAIGYGAFEFCSSLTCITIPDSVTSIRNYTFFSCPSLTSVTLPASITNIENHAFPYKSSITFTVPRDSYAAQYCKDNKLTYTYPDSLDWLNN